MSPSKPARPVHRLVDFCPRGNEDGWLVSLQAGIDVPFEIRRVYYIFGTRPGVRRGMHAHHNLEQLVVCTSGSCTFVVDDGRQREEVRLDTPARGLYLGGIIWREMTDFSPGSVLMVLASDHYDESDYIRDYDEFRQLVAGIAQ